jgi:hypothetical protein
MASHLIPNDFIQRGDMKPETVAYTIPLTSLRVHDAMATNLPATAANDDLALITGTPGTDAPTVQAGDFGGADIERFASFEFVLPAEYETGGTVTLSAFGGMLTAIADGETVVDFSAWESTTAGAVGSDLVTTAAQSINSLTFADKSFAVTSTGLAAGDRLIVRVRVQASDEGNLAVMIPELTKIAVNLTVRG